MSGVPLRAPLYGQAREMDGERRIRVELYESKHKMCWDEFVRCSKNGVFLFYRDYMEYHADRFDDYSLLFYQDDKLVALMPANRVDDTVESHGGLTFGGIVSGPRMTTTLMLRVFAAFIDDLRARGVRNLIYKAIPHFYHNVPAEEGLYALFVHNATLIRRNVSSTLIAGQRLQPGRTRRKILKHAEAEGFHVGRSLDFERFMAIAAENLALRHGRKPVHTAEEMRLLAERFPDNIKLYAVNRGEEMLGGVIIYENQNVAHGQYRHATEEGMRLGALDYVMHMLMEEIYRNKPYFDFGISTEEDGRKLNFGLIKNKEAYGARATVYDSYELIL